MSAAGRSRVAHCNRMTVLLLAACVRGDPRTEALVLLGSTSIESRSAWAELFARDNCEPRSKNALQLGG